MTLVHSESGNSPTKGTDVFILQPHIKADHIITIIMIGIIVPIVRSDPTDITVLALCSSRLYYGC